MQSHYTQLLARIDRPTQVLGALAHLDAYIFPHAAAGTLICERTSEALDVRIVKQVASGISKAMGRDQAVLAFAGEEGRGFWCGLFDNSDVPRFEHNCLVGPRNFQETPVNSRDVEILCDYFGESVLAEDVHAALTEFQDKSALERHAALAQSLQLPNWSVGIGYSRIVEGRVPPEAGTPRRPPRCLADLQPIPEWVSDIKAPDSKEWFQLICQRAFSFLEEEFGFRRGPSPSDSDHQDPYRIDYRNQKLTVLIEGLSYGGLTRLRLINREGHLLDLTGLIERRDPVLLDLCHLATGQKEQIPIFAEALRKCAGDVLAGDTQAISRIKDFKPRVSFHLELLR